MSDLQKAMTMVRDHFLSQLSNEGNPIKGRQIFEECPHEDIMDCPWWQVHIVIEILDESLEEVTGS